MTTFGIKNTDFRGEFNEFSDFPFHKLCVQDSLDIFVFLSTLQLGNFPSLMSQPSKRRLNISYQSKMNVMFRNEKDTDFHAVFIGVFKFSIYYSHSGMLKGIKWV